MSDQTDSPISRLTRSKEALLEALKDAGAGIGNDLAHIRSPWHKMPSNKKKGGSLSVFQHQDGAWMWKDHSTPDDSYSGTILQVLSRAEMEPDMAKVAKTVIERYGHFVGLGGGSKACMQTPSQPAKKAPKDFATLDELANWAAEKAGGSWSRKDLYNDREGNPVMASLRIELEGGEKTIRPAHLKAGRWRLGDPDGPLPLFNLDGIHNKPGQPVVIVEGEKCAQALIGLGFVATTSAHGAKSPEKTDWRPLTGREVVLWRDNDAPGLGYQQKALELLDGLEPRVDARVVAVEELGLPEKGDVADLIDQMALEGADEPERWTRIDAILSDAPPAPTVWHGGVDLDGMRPEKILGRPDLFRPVVFVSTGYGELDRALGGGWALGESTNLFGPSGMGKSAFMANLALRAASQDAPSAIISLEMPEQDVWRLVTGIRAEIPRLALRNPALLRVEEAGRWAEAIRAVSKMPLWVVDRRRFPADEDNPEAPTTEAVAKVIRDGQRHCGWRVIFLDYLAKVGPFDSDDLRRLPRLTNWAFDLAQRAGVHLVCLFQTNKSAWNRKKDGNKSSFIEPKRTISLEDAKGSVEVIADFDNAIGLVRDDWNTGEPLAVSPMTAAVLKARQGPGGAASLEFHRETGRISCADDRQQAKGIVEWGPSPKGFREAATGLPDDDDPEMRPMCGIAEPAGNDEDLEL